MKYNDDYVKYSKNILSLKRFTPPSIFFGPFFNDTWECSVIFLRKIFRAAPAIHIVIYNLLLFSYIQLYESE